MSERLRKKLVYVAYLVAGSLFFVWLGIGEYWNGKLPRVPDETVGRVYPLHFHGTDGYANQIEIAIFWAIPLVAAALIVVITWIDNRTKKED